jgi:hypothetical protein
MVSGGLSLCFARLLLAVCIPSTTQAQIEVLSQGLEQPAEQSAKRELIKSPPSLTALGALTLPVGLMKWNRKVLTFAAICWRIAGVLFVLFSVMNFFTHIGLLMNTSDSF